jgi:hypothetical protein
MCAEPLGVVGPGRIGPRRVVRFPTFWVGIFDPNEDEVYVFATLDELLGDEEDELIDAEPAWGVSACPGSRSAAGPAETP